MSAAQMCPSAPPAFVAMLALVALILGGCAAPPGGASDPAMAPDPQTARPAGGRMTPSLAGTDFGLSIARTVRTHPALGAGSARIRAAQAELDGVRSVVRPQVSFGAERGFTLVGGGSGRATPLLEVRQLLFDGGAARSRTAAADAGVARSRSDRVGIAADLAFSAVEAKFTLGHEERLLALAEANLDVHREFLAQIEDRLQAGAGTEADLLTARSRLADATARAVAATGRLERAQAAYREVFGTPPQRGTALRQAPDLPQLSEATLVGASPRLRSLAAEQAAAEAARAAAEAGRLPSVSVAVRGSTTRAGRATVGGDLSLRYDLATGGQRTAAIRAAEARVAEIDAEADQLRRQILRALENVRADRRTGVARVAAARAALDANQASVAAAREQFAIGRRSFTQLLDAQRDVVAASEALALAELDLALSGFAVLALTGDILDVFGIALPPVDDRAEQIGGASDG